MYLVCLFYGLSKCFKRGAECTRCPIAVFGIVQQLDPISAGAQGWINQFKSLHQHRDTSICLGLLDRIEENSFSQTSNTRLLIIKR